MEILKFRLKVGSELEKMVDNDNNRILGNARAENKPQLLLHCRFNIELGFKLLSQVFQ